MTSFLLGRFKAYAAAFITFIGLLKGDWLKGRKSALDEIHAEQMDGASCEH